MYKNYISNSNKIRIYSAPPYSIVASRGAEQLQTYMQFDRLVIFVYLHPSIIHPFPAVRILYNDSAAQKDAERSFDNETGLHLSHRRAISL